MKYIEMKVSSVVLDSTNYTPTVILKDVAEKNTLPIWIGVMEAAAILSELEKLEIERPMTHDLTRDIVSSLGAVVQEVTVDDMKDNIFYGTISLRSSAGELLKIDSRPSDAIAIAIRCKAPILINENLILKARVVDLRTERIRDKSPDELVRILKNMSAEDFGKYKI